MKASPVKPILWLMMLIMIISVACGTSTAPTATLPPTMAPPTNTPLPPPTNTLPPPTPTETQVPPAPEVSPETGDVRPTSGPSLPVNCEDSPDPGYITCYDNTGSIVMDVPDTWVDVNGGAWDFDGEIIGDAITAAPDLASFNAYIDAEGVFFGASDTFARIMGYTELLDYYTTIYRDDCDLVDRYDYNDGYYRGKYDQFTNCGGRGGYDAYVLSAVDIEDQFAMIILVMIQTLPGDTLTVDQIWNTFWVLDL